MLPDGAKFHVMPSLGDEFRVAREARGLSLSDVAEQLHIRSIYLQAIEEEDWPVIGAPVYVKGFLRTYARFLGVDPEHAIESFTASAPAAPPSKQAWVPPASAGLAGERRGPSLWAWLSGLAALALLAYVGYGYYQLKTGPPAQPATPKVAGGVAGTLTPPSAAPRPSVAAAPAPRWTGNGVEMRFTQVSWVRAIVDGHVVMEGEFPPGTHREFTGRHVRLLVGNAGGVEVSVPGQPTRILGSPGQVVERDYTLRAAQHGK
jgi:transcriptional regulator with XRE-family HTH domain